MSRADKCSCPLNSQRLMDATFAAQDQRLKVLLVNLVSQTSGPSVPAYTPIGVDALGRRG
jgi:hypothetical protein